MVATLHIKSIKGESCELNLARLKSSLIILMPYICASIVYLVGPSTCVPISLNKRPLLTKEREREREREKEREGEEREGCICAIPVPFPCPSHVVLRFHLLRPSGDLGPTRLGPVGGGLGLLRATLGSQLRRDPIPARWTKERRSRRYRWRMVCFFVGRWGQVLWEGDSGECSR